MYDLKMIREYNKINIYRIAIYHLIIYFSLDIYFKMLYDLIMPSIVKKNIKGNIYYYARECKRINGKPKIIWQKYLGKAQDIISATVIKKPSSAIVFEYGAIAALLSVVQRLNIVEIINRHIPKIPRNGVTTGHYILLAAINRVVCPKSKSRIASWYSKTILKRIYPFIKENSLSSQRFWDNMDIISPVVIPSIERDITKNLIREYNIDLRCLVYDTTNFISYIDTFNNHCSLAQRGHNKQKRDNLRQIGLALLVSKEFHIPLFHKTYRGNHHDSNIFNCIINDLIERYREFSSFCLDITLIYDKGNNSKINQKIIEDSPYHFVGSLVPSQHKDLLAIKRAHFHPLDKAGMDGVSAYRTKKLIFGKEQTVIVLFNENLYKSQLNTIYLEIKKRFSKLDKLNESLGKRQKNLKRKAKPTRIESLKKKIDEILKTKYMKDIIRVKLQEDERGIKKILYRVNEARLDELKEKLFGKSILFTDNDSWSTEEIISAYRGQYQIEKAFKEMKNPFNISWYPMFHWTDQKILVHAFYCVLALLLSTLLYREVRKNNIDISMPELLEALGGIREIALIYPEKKKPQIVLSEMNDIQRQLYETLGLERYRQRVRSTDS